MPLTKKGRKIMSAMKETYGDDEKAKRVFYASANAGKIEGVHRAKDGLVPVADADGHMWTRAVPLADNDTELELLLEDGAVPTRDGYLKAMARVARVGAQTYRGYELGMPERDHVTLYRPPEEVFARDAMRSLANKPITLTHPKRMVDKSTWGKVAKGWSGNEVVRDGEYVRVPLMLADAAAIDAFEKGEARELSVGYTTDVDWTAGTTPDGTPYDGVQRAIRANHHALVPVARGGENLRFGDSRGSPFGDAATSCPNCGAALTGKQLACPQCGFDLKPTARAGERISMDFDPDQPRDQQGKWTAAQESHFQDLLGQIKEQQKLREADGHPKPDPDAIKPEDYDDNDQNWINTEALMHQQLTNPLTGGVSSRAGEGRPAPINVKIPKGSPFAAIGADSATDAAAGGTTEEGVMPIIKMFDNIPIQFADEVSAATMEREFVNLQRRLADAGSDNFGGKKAKPFGKKGNGNGDDDTDANDQDVDTDSSAAAATEAKRKKVTAEDALKKEIATRDGEIAVLKKQLADAAMSDAKVEALAAERIATLDAAKAFLPKDFKDSGKTLADIRRAAVGQSLGDAEIKDWDDAQIVGAFKALTKSGASKSGGAAVLADGMSRGMRAGAGMGTGTGVSLADAEKEAAKAYSEYVQRLTDGYKTPLTVVRN